MKDRMTRKQSIKLWFQNHPNKYLSTRQIRQTWGECGDRRMRELRLEGFKIVSKRREINGKKTCTFLWCHPAA